MLDFVIPFTVNNSSSTNPTNNTFQRSGLNASYPESRTSDGAPYIQEGDTQSLNRGLYFLSFAVLTGLAVVLILVLKFIRHYKDDRRTAREDQLRTVTWMEGESESDREQVQALVAQ